MPAQGDGGIRKTCSHLRLRILRDDRCCREPERSRQNQTFLTRYAGRAVLRIFRHDLQRRAARALAGEREGRDHPLDQRILADLVFAIGRDCRSTRYESAGPSRSAIGRSSAAWFRRPASGGFAVGRPGRRALGCGHWRVTAGEPADRQNQSRIVRITPISRSLGPCSRRRNATPKQRRRHRAFGYRRPTPAAAGTAR